MRRYLVPAIALPAAFLIAAAALAAGKTTLTLSGTASPSNLPAVKRAGVALQLKETTDTNDPSGVPPTTTKADIFLDDDFKITTKGLPRCRPAQIMGKSTAAARKSCRSSMVGTGSAVARVANGSGGHLDIPAVVSAFWGRLNDGRSAIILHTVLNSASVDIVLLVKHASGAYGTVLETPPGPAEPIHSFTLNLHRTYTANGQRRNFVAARCSHHKLLYKGVFEYSEGPSRTDTDTQACS